MINKEDIIKYILEHILSLNEKDLLKLGLASLVMIKTQLEIDLQKTISRETDNSNGR